MSRFADPTRLPQRVVSVSAVLVCVFLLFPSMNEAGLYGVSDQIVLLSPHNVDAVLVNASAAVVLEFYASWCGHCVQFSPLYKSLARDMREWKPAVDLAAIDCAVTENSKICRDYGISGYPSIKFFNAYSTNASKGVSIKGFSRDIGVLRHLIIDRMEAHEEPGPPACPPLEPISQVEINSFFETNSVEYLALIFEDSSSYVGREVTLDLLQFENVAVRRVLKTEEALVSQLGVTDFPSCYIYYPGGNATRLRVQIEARSFYSYALQRLPAVVRSGKPKPRLTDLTNQSASEPWRTFNSSKVYMADLESALSYSLRMEVSSHPILKGDALSALKRYTSVLAKFFPGRPMVTNLLKSVDSWLQAQTGAEVSYSDLRAVLDNTARVPNSALPEAERWVGCQGSKPHLRRYPCGVWTLFHVLTVQAKLSSDSDSSEPQEVLKAMQDYVQQFFGCRECAEHFSAMAEEGLGEVRTLSSAVHWLWNRHNRVNNRLAGALSEDPLFPKIQWPPPEMCPACHEVTRSGDHSWNADQVITFLVSHFAPDRLQTDYLEDEAEVLAQQSKRLTQETRRGAERRAREAGAPGTPPPIEEQGMEEEEEQEEEEQEEEEGGQEEPVADVGGIGGGGEEEVAAPVDEMAAESAPWADRPEVEAGGRGRWRSGLRRPGMAGLRLRDPQEDIVDLDSFVNQHFKNKALRAAAATAVRSRTLQRKEEPDLAPVFGLRMELDLGVGMVGLEPVEPAGADPDTQQMWMQKRELPGAFMVDQVQQRRWISVLNIGFSRLDISLCVVLYLLSSMCLMVMYLFFKNRLRVRRVKASLA